MPASAALREALSGALPDYMVPGAYVTVDAWPVNASGKLDRRALPAPDAAAVSNRFVAPHSEIEIVLAALWAEVLAISQVGVHDNFFELGGNSLLIVRLHQRVLQHYPRNCTLMDMFTYPTVASLARHLAAGEEDMAGEADGAARGAARRAHAQSRSRASRPAPSGIEN
ncbi:non-ribosomal peptide synthetase [Xanthomonas arboricola pv. juglandis]|nr:non-ribosomal peptide synthetase [Xanthomonas arboricola pv. juglandis]